MKKEYIKYGWLTLVIILILIFVYPTLYQYDKFNQKLPIRMNRISGTTEMFDGTGWNVTEKEKPKASEMNQFKKDMDDRFNNLRDSIEKDISDKLSSQVVTSIKGDLAKATSDIQDDIAKAKSEIADYKKSQLDPNNSFTVGSTEDVVKKIMGTPTSISTISYLSTWYYGSSRVEFSYDKVTGWNEGNKKLNTK